MTQDKQELEKNLIKNDGNQDSIVELQNQANNNCIKINTVQNNKKLEIEI